MNSNGASLAFPTQMWDVERIEATWIDGGLTKREYFAAAALQGLCSRIDATGASKKFAESAVDMADALIEELAKPLQPLNSKVGVR